MTDTGHIGTDHPVISRLSHYHGADRKNELLAIFDAVEAEAREYERDAQIWVEMERPDFAMMLEEGWAFHHKELPGGERQICQILVPGDILDGASLLPGGQTMTGIRAASDLRVRAFGNDRLRSVLVDKPEVAQALWWAVVQTDNIFREHIARVGRLTSAQALAHLLLELAVRCRMAGTARGDAIQLPLTQTQLADYLGISSVHVSRTLGMLRSAGFLSLENRLLRILRWDELCEFCCFSDDYLTVGCQKAPSGQAG